MENPIKKTFGLAISNTALTAVEVSRGKFGLKVVNYSRIELKPNIIEDNCIIINEQAFQDALKKLLLNAKKGPITAKNVIISIPIEKTFSHKLLIPKEHYNDDDYINNEAKDFIPITLDEAIVDYQIINGKKSDKNINYNFVAIQKSIINPLINTLKEVDLNVVGVNTDKNSLIRTCNNEYQKNEGDFLIMYIDSVKTILTINTASGMSYHTNIYSGGEKFCKLIQEELKLPTPKNAQDIIIKYKKDPNSITAEQKSAIQKKLQDEYNSIVIKTNELIKIIKNQEDLNLKTIYLIGKCSGSPGISETIKVNYPKIEIKQQLSYVEINNEAETHYSHAIGLALKDVIGISRENDINLLPNVSREKIEATRIIPIVKKYLIGISLLFGCLMILFGTMAGRNYMDYRFGARELNILNEKTMNPYLNEIAKTNQEKTQLKNAIMNILEDAVPGSQIMKLIDNYNSNGVGLINVSYKINSKKEIEIRIRAKTISRNETENFILKLEQNPYFFEVESPLTNLAGKGECFININLKLDPYKIINGYEQEKKQEEKEIKEELESENTEDKKPSLPKVTEDKSIDIPEEAGAEHIPSEDEEINQTQ